jgi:hypothetical protein
MIFCTGKVHPHMCEYSMAIQENLGSIMSILVVIQHELDWETEVP